MSISPNNSPNFRSARVLIFPDGTLTPEGVEAVKRKPDDMAEVLRQQNERIAELLVQVKNFLWKIKKHERSSMTLPCLRLVI